jgi:uncharacterized membrane protein YeiH
MHEITTFGIPLWAELVAVCLGALQGALFAGAFADRRIDVLGVVLIGIGGALGGSVVRDLLLGEPPVVIRGEWYVLVAGGAALLGMCLQPVFARLGPVILALDAVTIGLFGVIGASKALSLGVPSVPAMFVGTLAAVGGTVLRDVMLDRPVTLLHIGTLYAVAAAAGTLLLVVLVAVGVPVPTAAIAGVVLTTAVRLLAVGLGWSFPAQQTLVLRRRRVRTRGG